MRVQATGSVLVPARVRHLPNGYRRPHFKATQGTTQSRIISPILFNLIVGNVVRNWLELTVEYQLVTHEGLVLAVGGCLGPFYADDGLVELWYPEWIQGALKFLIVLFQRYRLVENVANSKAVTFQSGTLRSEC